ncbi:MAG: hypothetical protein DRR16_11075, partial [Candidatus Parabeggiatoa sp. nov. 3]
HREAFHREASHREAFHREASHREAFHREASHREAFHREASLALICYASRLYWHITFLALICIAAPTGRLTFEPVFYQKKNLGA